MVLLATVSVTYCVYFTVRIISDVQGYLENDRKNHYSEIIQFYFSFFSKKSCFHEGLQVCLSMSDLLVDTGMVAHCCQIQFESSTLFQTAF